MKRFRHPQTCALARSAELLAERWTLLVVRELLTGPRRFSELRQSLDGITASVLSERLGEMRRAGLIAREATGKSAVYSLTADGRALTPAVFALIRWGARFLLPPRPGDRIDPRWLRLALEAHAKTSGAPDMCVDLVISGDGPDCALNLRGGPQGTRVETGLADAAVRIGGSAQSVLALMAGLVDASNGMPTDLRVEEGDPGVLPRFAELFEVDLGGKP